MMGYRVNLQICVCLLVIHVFGSTARGSEDARDNKVLTADRVSEQSMEKPVDDFTDIRRLRSVAHLGASTNGTSASLFETAQMETESLID
ncbi:hypothetical protein BESB_077090 [Besnoitia besnoiti]|uniref:Uncharacterized protein n=1 Tax=Besnoitia besnoiti TaxID=94643 RepID=A0A2A9MDN2_BESBE|nr:hypothetical protein BESB_077090 [Besnoitia besnoiti]PFH33492.1 hypothetical protein BESB_077090 [Besnoitia besnoiti]